MRAAEIWNDHSVLIVSNCNITGNSGGSGNGAGIYCDGSSGYAQLSLIASTVSGNTGWGGAGIYNYGYQGTSHVSVATCTISGNIASGPGVVGGGIWNDGNFGIATLVITLSTFSGNSAPQSGGGIYNGGASGTAAISMDDCTFNGNSASNGSSIFNLGNSSGTATVSIADTILKTVAVGANIANNLGTVTSVGYNLASDNGDGFLINATDKINTDPMLGPLANNGGPTFTHALLPGSPAIDKGKSFGLPTDQRGFPRTVDDLWWYRSRPAFEPSVYPTPKAMTVPMRSFTGPLWPACQLACAPPVAGWEVAGGAGGSGPVDGRGVPRHRRLFSGRQPGSRPAAMFPG